MKTLDLVHRAETSGRLGGFWAWLTFHVTHSPRPSNLLPWIRTLTGRTRIDYILGERARPWVVMRALKTIEMRLPPEARCLEWGSGGSTLWLARRSDRVVSIEHDSIWWVRVRKALHEVGLTNVELVCVPPDPEGSADGTEAISASGPVAGMSFSAYVEAGSRYPPAQFDLVLVDGRARSACVRAARRLVRPGGLLVLDDAHRPRYRHLLEDLAGWNPEVFVGTAPYSFGLSSTVIWTAVAPDNSR